MKEQDNIQLPRYKCHKEVWALKIKGVFPHDDGSATFQPEDERYTAFLVNKEYVEKHNPVAGGYYVLYKGGYKSFSPAEAFEGGYTNVRDLPIEQNVALKIAYGETGLKCSHQQKFPSAATCVCGEQGRIAFVVYEEGGEAAKGQSFVCDMHKNRKDNMWVHDVIAVAVYLCRKCLKPIAICNQG